MFRMWKIKVLVACPANGIRCENTGRQAAQRRGK